MYCGRGVCATKERPWIPQVVRVLLCACVDVYCTWCQQCNLNVRIRTVVKVSGDVAHCGIGSLSTVLKINSACEHTVLKVVVVSVVVN